MVRYLNWIRWVTFSFAGLLIIALASNVEVSQAQDKCAKDATLGGCELILPKVCSRDPAVSTAPPNDCQVTDLPNAPKFKRVHVNLTAQTAKITVGGYIVETENYNGTYLPNVIVAHAGDTVAATLKNLLKPHGTHSFHAGHAGHAGHEKDNPTNLHFFHGGVVTPRNARSDKDLADDAALLGNGDNVYTYLKSNAPPFTYEVPIPLALDGRVLEERSEIAHPSGLNWFHSHLHGVSSEQVMGGLSGLLSVGDGDANVVACAPDPADKSKCLGDKKANDEATETLRKQTDVRYALLRDIPLHAISALPDSDTVGKTAIWDRKLQEQTLNDLGVSDECYVWLEKGGRSEDPKLRKGYCQHEEKKAWLFTVNGQRFPTITVKGGRNLLIRLGNLSSNVAYWLELNNEKTDKDLKQLLLLSIDGVVPVRPVDPEANTQPVRATAVDDLVLMPASRAEIYIRNDRPRKQKVSYILRTKGLVAGNGNPLNDRWPEIQLLRIDLEPSEVASEAEIALNPVTAGDKLKGIAPAFKKAAPEKPTGCVDDIDPALAEHRRVRFLDEGETSDGRKTRWSILTEIVRPPAGAASPAAPYAEFKPDPKKTVGILKDGSFRGIPFEEYDLGNGRVDWNGDRSGAKHVCVFVDPQDPSLKNGLTQLWVLQNDTGDLHNFHIHQMKFRLAAASELTNTYKIKLDDPEEESTIQLKDDAGQLFGPIYRLYDNDDPDKNTRWHDTIPMPPGYRVYVIMSFVAEEQVGRYVFHCHVLKHEDTGLMAPIEVWKPPPAKGISK